MSTISKRYFSEIVQIDSLPPVANHLWERRNPFPAEVHVPAFRATEFELATLGRYFLAPQNRALIYPAGDPIITIPSRVFTTRLIPLGGAPLTAADLPDLRINVGVMQRKVCGVATSTRPTRTFESPNFSTFQTAT